MNQRIYEKIRTVLETTPGLTQKGLAERMGLNPAAINRMLYGRRNIMAEEIPMIEEYLGVKLDLSSPSPEYRQDNRPLPRRGFAEAPAARFQHAPEADAQMMMPVYAYDDRGCGDIVDWVVRHPALFGISSAFAVYAFSDAMAPRYFRGELVYLHPGRPPETNRDCLVEMTSGEAGLYRFLQQNDRKIRVSQLNPAQEKDISRDDIRAIYAVVGRG